MLNMRNVDLAESIRLNGKEIKEIITMEELAELSQQVSKDLRGKLDRGHLIEEMADVYICLQMLKLIHEINDNDIQDWIDYKIDRQIRRDQTRE